MKKFIRIVLFLIGLSLCFYPLVSDLIVSRDQKNAINTYQKNISLYEKETVDDSLAKAREYNEIIYQTNGKLLGDVASDILSDKNYNSILNPVGSGIMGSIEIPRINVNLPIYHGTDESVLSVGIGHLKESSFPVGGINTRTILTGHRGLPDSKLFTRLDELEEGDLFFLYILNDVLAYKITEIQVIKPEETEKIKISQGKDLATLITCTPYGINTHRLVVTGERALYEKEKAEVIKRKMMSPRELLFICIPFLFVGYGVMNIFKKLKRRKMFEKQTD